MPYLRVDLDGKKKWPQIANGLGISRGDVAAGFLDMWELCWAARSDTLGLLQLECLFGAAGDRVAAVLEGFGFAERLKDGLVRIRGFTAYLDVTKARSEAGKKGGKATAGKGQQLRNLKQNTEAIASVASSNAEANTEAPPKPLHLNTHTPMHLALEDSAGEQPPPVKKAPKGKQEKQTDPRHAPMVARLVAVFLEVKGYAYDFKPADARALSNLLGRNWSPEEIERRWRIGLASAFPTCDRVLDLENYWNSFGAAKGAGPPARPDADPNRQTGAVANAL